KYKIGEMDVDIETSIDAQRVADATGVQSIQIHNMGLCHIDADMTSRALVEYDTTDYDFLILENIGNLVCPAEFDVGANKNLMLLSVPEGDDKPLKYPLMFEISDVVLINKIDTLDYFDFSKEKVTERIKSLNPNAKIFFVSGKTGEGLDDVVAWLEDEIAAVK
ncbi:MAG: hydrogenase nickel incorporation protein HypB, partial [Pseudobutyrivibrio sp.]|nr:hydrogenase nickel incorporation protein HypB [Pseudobutyrivibrio sp.]